MTAAGRHRYQGFRIGRAPFTIALCLFTAFLAFSQGFVRSGDEPKHQTVTLRGRIVWLAEALEKRYGIESVPEAKERMLALQTADGQIHPIVEDVRGRSFRLDERLRKPEVELVVRRFDGSPAVQVIRIYEIAKDGKYELDYWCEICSIAMFELKACDCCQGDIDLRRRKADGP